jgi:urate oxidase
MTIRLAKQSYGKSNVRLTKVTRFDDRHELKELSVDVALDGDFSESYLAGDNARVVATDTMKNTVYALAVDHPLVDGESFALDLAAHFVNRNAHVTSATISIAETLWKRIDQGGAPHRHSFISGGAEKRICRVRVSREKTSVHAGLMGLPLLKTTNSAFRGFPRDEFTTLPEVDDRIFATLLNAEWNYVPGDAGFQYDWNSCYGRIHTAMVAVFADHKSLAVQQTLYAMGEAALGACPQVDEIHLAMPNQHRISVDVRPFGKEHRNEIFVTTSEPYGLITATLRREGI